MTWDTHSTQGSQKLRVGEDDDGHWHDKAGDNKEVSVAFRVVLHAFGVPVGTAGGAETLWNVSVEQSNFFH